MTSSQSRHRVTSPSAVAVSNRDIFPHPAAAGPGTVVEGDGAEEIQGCHCHRGATVWRLLQDTRCAVDGSTHGMECACGYPMSSSTGKGLSDTVTHAICMVTSAASCERMFKAAIATEVLPAGIYWPAEAEHQGYLFKGGRFGAAQSNEKGCRDPIRCYG